MLCAGRMPCLSRLGSLPYRLTAANPSVIMSNRRLISSSAKVLNRPGSFPPAPAAAEPGAMAMPLPGQRPLWRDLIESRTFWACIAAGAAVYFPSRHYYSNDVYFKEEVDFWWKHGHESVLSAATEMCLDVREWYIGDEGSYIELDQFWAEHRAREKVFQTGEERTMLLLSEDAVDYTADLPYVWRGVTRADAASRKLWSYILDVAPEDRAETRKAAQILLENHSR